MRGAGRRRRRRAASGALAVFVMTAVGAPALAEDGALSELKVGVMVHDVPILSNRKEDGVDANGEVLWLSPQWLDWLGAPRPHIGVHVNTNGDTSQAYAGLTWTYDPPALDPVWGAFSFGGAVHNGETDPTTDRSEKALGSPVLFRLGLEIGYDVTERTSVSILYDHVSNANLADDNEGLNNIGLRVGYRF